MNAHAGDSTPVHAFNFSTDVVVRFAETDAQGVAHNAAYLVWFEVARIDYLARFAGGYQAIRDQGLEALTIESHVRYLAPVGFDDPLRIHARCGDVRGARFGFEYAVECRGKLVADGWTRHAVVDAQSLRPTRFPDWLKKALATAEEAPSA
jgi:acyl-CoA thioester hydrolase